MKQYKKLLCVMLTLCMLLSMLPVTALAAGGDPITIKVRVYDQSSGKEYVVGTDTAYKADKYIQSQPYEIPALTRFVAANTFGRVTRVIGNWYFPTGDQNVGATVYWSNNSSTGTMTYWVDHYAEAGGEQPGTPTPSDVIDLGGGSKALINFTVVYHTNYPNGKDYTHTQKYKVRSYTSTAAMNIFSSQLKSYSDCGFGGFEPKATEKTWYKAADCASTLNSIYAENNKTYHAYAGWKDSGTVTESFTVTFNYYGDSKETKTVLSSDPTIVLPNAERDGYTFKGWSTTVGGAAAYQPGNTFTVTSDTTFYAVWEKNTVTITYHDGNMSRVAEVQKGANYTIEEPHEKNEGYAFQGWSTTEGGTTVAYTQGQVIVANADLELYPVWTVSCGHDKINWTDNGNGTHKGTCKECDKVVIPSEAHIFTYTVNEDGTHTGVCKCGATVTEAHTYDENHHCVCGAEEGFFTVFYSSENIANKVYMSECEGGYSFTDKVHDGYLYGGVYTNNTYMEASAYKFDGNENGLHFTPKADETYYVREIDAKTLHMKLVASYKGSDVLNIYLMASIDATYMDAARNVQGYMAIGFLEGNGNTVTRGGIDFSDYAKKNASAYYNSITINVGGHKYKFTPTATDDLGFGLNENDKLYYYALGKNYVNDYRDKGTRNVVAYYETCDGVIVTGTEMCTFSIASNDTNVQGFTRTAVPSCVYPANAN